MLISCANALGAGGFARGKVKVPTTNPGAEQGSTTAWTVTNGFTVGQDNPASGAWHFKGGPNTPSSAYQDVDIPSSYHTDVDAGNIYVTVIWQQGHGGNSSTGNVTAQFIDSGESLIDPYHGPLESAKNTWTSVEFTVNPIPTGSRKVRITMNATKVGGGVNDAWFDDIEVYIGLNAGKMVSTSAPTVSSNTTRLADTVTTVNGSWDQTPDSYTYRWLRDGVPIDGEVATTYAGAPTSDADQYKNIKAEVTAIKDGFPTIIQASNQVYVDAPPFPEYEAISWSSGNWITVTDINGVALTNFRKVRLAYDGMTLASSSFELNWQGRVGGTWQTSINTYKHFGNPWGNLGSASHGLLHYLGSSSSTGPFYGVLEIDDVWYTNRHVWQAWGGRLNTSAFSAIGGRTTWTGAINGVRLGRSGTNLTGGTVRAYGYYD